MNIYAINYVYDDSTASARDEVRPIHVEFLQECFDRGRLLVSGPVDEGAGALLIVTGNDEDDALSLMDNDPFAQHQLITERGIRKWGVFFGKDKLVPAQA
ncbi:MAG TPA: YciI family protein [Enteractinococcus sp.]